MSVPFLIRFAVINLAFWLFVESQAVAADKPIVHDKKITVVEVPIANSLNAISLFGDGIADVVTNTRYSGHGTIVGGVVEFLINDARVDGNCDWDKSTLSDSQSKFSVKKMDWSDHFVYLDSFKWSTHVGDVYYKSVYLYQKYIGNKWAGTYVIAPELVQSADAQSLNDIENAKMTLHVFGLLNTDNSGQGTGPCRSIAFLKLTDRQPSHVTGQPDDLKKEFEKIIRSFE